MGTIERRLAALEGAFGTTEEKLQRQASREFLGSLSDEERDWILEPAAKAERWVACPLHGPRCDCSNEPRQQRGVDDHPELLAEYEERSAAAYKRYLEYLEKKGTP